MKIAFFDSGIGGLSVLNEALKRFSGVEFLYFADTDNVPYGTKDKEEIKNLSAYAIEFLISQGAQAVVVACNTATSAAVTYLREKFSIPIVGMEPAVKLAFDKFPGRPTLLIATELTIKGEKLRLLVERLGNKTLALPLPRLVEFAQKGEFQSAAVSEYLRKELSKFNLGEISSVVLGCTHFNYFKDTLRKILPPNAAIIDGIDGTLKHLTDILGRSRFSDTPNSVRYFNSCVKADPSEVKIFESYLKRLEKMSRID